jgi:hypothetical protein
LIKNDKIKNFDKKLFLLFFFTSYVCEAFFFVSNYHKNDIEGSSLNHKVKNDSGIAFLKKNYDQIKIYSNMADLLKINGLNQVEYIPYIYDPSSRLPNPNMEKEIATILIEYEQKRAIFVFSNGGFRDFLIDYSKLQHLVKEKPDTLSEKVIILKKGLQ